MINPSVTPPFMNLRIIEWRQSPREKELGLAPYPLKYRAPKNRGYYGFDLLAIRILHGVGRPPAVNLARKQEAA